MEQLWFQYLSIAWSNSNEVPLEAASLIPENPMAADYVRAALSSISSLDESWAFKKELGKAIQGKVDQVHATSLAALIRPHEWDCPAFDAILIKKSLGAGGVDVFFLQMTIAETHSCGPDACSFLSDILGKLRQIGVVVNPFFVYVVPSWRYPSFKKQNFKSLDSQLPQYAVLLGKPLISSALSASSSSSSKNAAADTAKRAGDCSKQKVLTSAEKKYTQGGKSLNVLTVAECVEITNSMIDFKLVHGMTRLKNKILKKDAMKALSDAISLRPDQTIPWAEILSTGESGSKQKGTRKRRRHEEEEGGGTAGEGREEEEDADQDANEE
jgi:hypothetical protein